MEASYPHHLLAVMDTVTEILQEALEDACPLTTAMRSWSACARLQLCLGRDLRWYPYARSDQDWEPSGSPDPARPGPCRTYDATPGRTQGRGRC